MIKGLIVCVEDSADDIALMKRIFDKEVPNVNIIFFDDSIEALQWFKEVEDNSSLPGLILLDINMPKMSGLDLLKELKKLKLLNNAPIAMLSSSTQMVDKQEAYKSGVNSYLEKPKSYTELKEKLPIIARYWLELNK